MRLVVAVVDEAGIAGIEIDRVQAAVEMHLRTGIFGQLQQRGVEVLAVDRPDHFAVVAAVALQLRLALARVHHAAAHHHRLGHHRVFDPGLAQRVAAAFGQGQVDRAAGLVIGDARIAAAFVKGDPPALAGQQDGQQGAGQACADDAQGAMGGSDQGGSAQEWGRAAYRPAQDSTSSTKWCRSR
ncbi:hypothetical protein D9M71_681780 [compost metagenome]